MPRDRSSAQRSAAPLPDWATQVCRHRPELWDAFHNLGEQASRAGPLEARARRLVHLALAIASESEGATHSHTRRGLAEGLKPEELEHVAVLGITTLGWPHAMRGLSWVQDLTRASWRPEPDAAPEPDH